MKKQNQSVGSDAVAVQAGDHSEVHIGYSADDVKELLHTAVTISLEAALPSYTLEASKLVDQRMRDLEDKILARLAQTPEKSAKALKTPDFLYALNKANITYARSGEPELGDIIVDLIADRASETTRTRLAMTLNESIERIGLLTRAEFAELSLVYLLTKTRRVDVINFNAFLHWLQIQPFKFLPDCSRDAISYEYLEAINCGRLASVGKRDFRILFTTFYGGVLSSGFTLQDFDSRFSDQFRNRVMDILVPCLHDKSRWQFRAISSDVLASSLVNRDITPHTVKSLWAFFSNTFWPLEELMDRVGSVLPMFKELQLLWDTTPICKFEINTIGVAIGHANARRVAGLEADLSVWIS